MGLGALHSVSLAQARARAADCRFQRASGLDPIEARDAVRASPAPLTFEAVAVDYLASHGSALSAKHRKQWASSLRRYVYPHIGNVPVAGVDTDAVSRVLAPIWATKVATASRVRGRIEAVLGAATVRGLRAGPNPAMWRGNLSHLLPKKSRVRRVAHFAAMPYAELPAFVATLRARDGLTARALELLILTAARTGEIINMRWAEVDVAAALWTIPEHRMKARIEHRVPLARPALAVLAALPRDPEYVFPGARRSGPMHHDVLIEALKEQMGRGDVTVHGFRSTFRDWAGETTSFPNHVVEMALAHTIGNAVEAAYRRGDLLDKRRELMAAWGTYCGGRA
jgi:integrase